MSEIPDQNPVEIKSKNTFIYVLGAILLCFLIAVFLFLKYGSGKTSDPVIKQLQYGNTTQQQALPVAKEVSEDSVNINQKLTLPAVGTVTVIPCGSLPAQLAQFGSTADLASPVCKSIVFTNKKTGYEVTGTLNQNPDASTALDNLYLAFSQKGWVNISGAKSDSYGFYELTNQVYNARFSGHFSASNTQADFLFIKI